MGSSTWFYLPVASVLGFTAKAMKVCLEKKDAERYGVDEEFWIPMSVVNAFEDYEIGDTDCEICIEEWWAVKRGLCDERDTH